MRVLVTGGHGFVGKAVTELVRKRELDAFPRSRRDGLDLRRPATVREALRDLQPDAIVNCASHGGSLHYVTEFAADVVHDNMEMILHLYRSMRDVVPDAVIVNPISNCSYPGDADVQRESEWWDGPVHPSVWSFANAKRLWVVVSQCYAKQHGTRTVNLMAPNAYGPGDHTDPNKTHALNGMVIRMLQAKWNGDEEFVIWGTGSPVREWIYVADLARFLVDAIHDAPRPDPVNLAQNQGYAIRETAEMIKAATGFEGRLTFDTSYQDGAPVKILDASEFREGFPEASFTPMEEGIRNTVAYYEEVLPRSSEATEAGVG